MQTGDLLTRQSTEAQCHKTDGHRGRITARTQPIKAAAAALLAQQLNLSIANSDMAGKRALARLSSLLGHVKEA